MLLGAAPDPVAAVQAEIEDLAPDMREFDGPDRLFRPYAAGGILDAQVLSRAAIDHLERQGYTCVLWNCVPHDWDDPDGWVDTALSEIQSRSWTVVVLHDVDTGAMAHLGRFIGQVRQTGGELVGDFPPDCVPIVGGRTVLPISHLTPRSAQPSTHPAPTKEAAS
jgi:hypothetical protein